ncbi:MAG: division/cell wall cluster transcriptional repressor MraZ [Alphaproteobacteria bacterium]|nr:division/cell wall cluster transcriptional repressor MraZ [Alphaproteobacteria bacterium]
MAFFLSTFKNKVDKKGRVSVPAPFRSAVASGNFPGIVVYRPLNLPCIEGADMSFLEQLSDRLYGDFGPFNPDQMSVATAILAGSSQLQFDPEGRVMLPNELRDFAGIDGFATFVGLGRKFQIWGAEAYEAHREEQLAMASETAPKLPPFGGGGQS